MQPHLHEIIVCVVSMNNHIYGLFGIEKDLAKVLIEFSIFSPHSVVN
jgi:hypothetical protein